MQLGALGLADALRNACVAGAFSRVFSFNRTSVVPGAVAMIDFSTSMLPTVLLPGVCCRF